MFPVTAKRCRTLMHSPLYPRGSREECDNIRLVGHRPSPVASASGLASDCSERVAPTCRIPEGAPQADPASSLRGHASRQDNTRMHTTTALTRHLVSIAALVFALGGTPRHSGAAYACA